MLVEDDGFDPLDETTWRPRELSVQERAEIDCRIERIQEVYKVANESRQLLHYLRFKKAEMAFHRQLRKDAELKRLVEWIKSSEPREERAIRELDIFVNSVCCPHCGSQFRRGEEIEVAQEAFDWQQFAADEIPY